LVHPIRAEERVIDLALESADVVALAVQLNDGLRLHAAQDSLAGHQVVEAHGGGVGGEAKRAGDQTVGQNDFIGVFTAKHPGLK
jgi:hypothetical protein